MPRELVAIESKKPVLREYEENPLDENEVRIKTEFSSPKHGTELHVYRGTSPFQDKEFSPAWRMFLPREGATSLFPRRLGNMSVGTVVEVGRKVSKFKVGDKVYGHLPIRETHTISKRRVEEGILGMGSRERQIHILPREMSSQEAVCLDPAHFALAAVRDANVRVGAKVAIFGLGAIGLMAVQMVKLSGVELVFASDPLSNRRNLAKKYGADQLFDSTRCNVGFEMKKATGKKGVDVAIEISGSDAALSDAIRSVHYCGLVVTASFHHGRANALRLGEEWFHNRITLRCSMPVWDNPSRDYPMWDARRLEDTAFHLMRDKKLTADGMITPTYPFEKSVEAYKFINEHPDQCIKLGITYQSRT